MTIGIHREGCMWRRRMWYSLSCDCIIVAISHALIVLWPNLGWCPV